MVEENPPDAAAPAPPSSKATDLIEVPGSSERRQCPKCHEVNPYMIKELTDKTKILNNYPTIYGKKYKCGKCGSEWRYSV
ncbi:MAG: hypothetical protein RBG13Loki_1443 [Promethearchaeota archaeon CR_4]|nr:MAG: hypothetical protein RBG13Loki_1443 [Candidatus Lokiarchaeota archaeon CR_4]